MRPTPAWRPTRATSTPACSSSTGGFGNDVQVKNGIGFAIDHGADILNLSLNYFATQRAAATSQLDLMLDWAAFNRGINCALCVGNIGTGSANAVGARVPAAPYNGITVGRTTADYQPGAHRQRDRVHGRRSDEARRRRAGHRA